MTEGTDAGEIVTEFLVESYEGLDQLDLDLIALEQNGTDAALLARVFRCVHTIKGTCGFLGFEKLEAVTHVGENLLARLRDGEIDVSAQLTSALLALVDAIREMLGHIERTGTETETSFDELVAVLSALCEQRREVPRIGDLLVEQGIAAPADVAAALREQQGGNTARVGEILVQRGVATPGEIRDALERQRAATESRQSAVADATIRVDVALLDTLMNLVGELVLARNQLLQRFSRGDDPTLASTTQRLNLITSELQEGVMKTRLQPIGSIWGKLPRVVRDLAASCGKQVVLHLDGANTELDKTIIEAIKDPITHIVRNSVDHGIESPSTRTAAGKASEGRLVMRAFHEGGKVNIEIRDDGAGIDPAIVRAKAIEKGIIAIDAAARLSDRDAIALIFAPGFSTAARVTNVSGRGVGMDVVKTNIERIGGTVDITSTRGEGTTIRIQIPLTLAIIPGLVVATGGGRYAIPQVSLLELVRLEGDEIRAGVELLYGEPVYRLRGKLLPLVSLRHTLGLADAPWRPHGETVVNIVVLHTEGVHFGLVVDAINDTEEIVVKPLGAVLKNVPVFSGATIMGDGHVALILDVPGLARHQGILGRPEDQHPGETPRALAAETSLQPREQLLLCAMGLAHRLALPLSVISRLEEFPVTAVERAGFREVVQYRGEILPLVRLDRLLPGLASPANDDVLRVVVCEHQTRSLGIVVGPIIDVVESATIDFTLGAHSPAAARALLADPIIVHDRVTDVLNVHALFERCDFVEGEAAYV